MKTLRSSPSDKGYGLRERDPVLLGNLEGKQNIQQTHYMFPHSFQFVRLPTWATVALAIAASTGAALAAPWKFGVMADTQWWDYYAAPDKNPNSVAVEIIRQVNPRFIQAGVKFVIQVGDLTDDGSALGIQTRAAACQDLYDAGIGFFPLRGNHDAYQQTGLALQSAFPQTQGNGTNLFGATHFVSPFPALAGLSYSFDFNNCRFVLLDQFQRTDGTYSTDPYALTGIIDQLPWLNDMLSAPGQRTHAFVFGHENIIGQWHVMTLFGNTPADSPAAQNTFISSLYTNGVRYYISGHDHVHNRTIIASPDGQSRIQQIICASDSSKFYIPNGSPLLPGSINNDIGFDAPPREQPVAQELFSIGYYIYTVDGPRVTGEYYSAIINPVFPGGPICYIDEVPVLEFTKRETFGYSLNGREFLITQGQSYTNVQDSIAPTGLVRGTTVKILSGVNQSTNTDTGGRPLVKTINTGWAPNRNEAASDTLSIWGLGELGTNRTDSVVLQLSFIPGDFNSDQLNALCLVTKNANGQWVKAVDLNTGGGPTRVTGPWNPELSLGAYGVEMTSHTAWAVVNHEGDFAVGWPTPSLVLQQTSTNFTLSWPAEVPGYQLQSCTDLAAGNWVPVTNSLVHSYSATPAPAGRQFFRLAVQ